MALAARMNYEATNNTLMPAAGNTSQDLSSLMGASSSGLPTIAAGFLSIPTTITVGADGTTTYNEAFTITPSGGGSPIGATMQVVLNGGETQTAYQGTLNYVYDIGTAEAAGSIDYQRTGLTTLATKSHYATYPTIPGTVYEAFQQIFSGGDLVPTYNAATNPWITFQRFSGTFDPTSPYQAGNYVSAKALTNQDTTSEIFQVTLNDNGAGSAFYGNGTSISDSGSNTILGIFCDLYAYKGTAISYLATLYAQYQPIAFNATDGQYELNGAPHTRYAPTSTCQWTDSQYDASVAGASPFWYDRSLAIPVVANTRTTRAALQERDCGSDRHRKQRSIPLQSLAMARTRFRPRSMPNLCGYVVPTIIHGRYDNLAG